MGSSPVSAAAASRVVSAAAAAPVAPIHSKTGQTKRRRRHLRPVPVPADARNESDEVLATIAAVHRDVLALKEQVEASHRDVLALLKEQAEALRAVAAAIHNDVRRVLRFFGLL